MAYADLLALSTELASVALCHVVPDSRVCRLTNKKILNKDFYLNYFLHLQPNELAGMVWRSAAPLKCKIFCWLAKRQCLPTNEQWF
jgi:hypothetical protein